MNNIDMIFPFIRGAFIIILILGVFILQYIISCESKDKYSLVIPFIGMFYTLLQFIIDIIKGNLKSKIYYLICAVLVIVSCLIGIMGKVKDNIEKYKKKEEDNR